MLFRLMDCGARTLLALDPKGFIETYGRLIPAFQEQIEAVPFDGKWYLKLYPDVAASISAGRFESAFEHFSNVGFWAGRLGAPMRVDEEWYRHNYSDIDRAMTSGLANSATRHFRDHGFFEGRAAGARDLVDCDWYEASYPLAVLELGTGMFINPQDHYNRRGFGQGYRASRAAELADFS